MSESPKVSICIPSYNHARFLPAAIESALAQTYRPLEVVIVDDGSTDESFKIAESYAAEYPTLVKVFTHEGHLNRGISATVNLGFEKASGVYYSGLPSDDILYPDKIERQVEFLEARPDVGFVYSHMDIIDEQGRLIKTRYAEDISGRRDQLERMIETNLIPGVTVLARRDCIAQAFPHAEELVYSDWEFWFRLLSICKVGFIARPLVGYRVHTYNTSVGVAPEVHLRHSLAVMEALRRKTTALSNPQLEALLDLRLSHMHYCAGDERAATSSLRSAFAADPALRNRVGYFSEWLEVRKAEIFHPQAAPDAFSEWLLKSLNAEVGASFTRKLARRVAAQKFVAEAFDSYRDHDLRRTRRLMLRCLRNDPRWLGDRLFLSIFPETLLGSSLTNQLRGFKNRLRGAG
jgi:glycosyltransferase involved in cell wall biosynthesis